MVSDVLLALTGLGLWLGLGILTALAWCTVKTCYLQRQERARSMISAAYQRRRLPPAPTGPAPSSRHPPTPGRNTPTPTGTSSTSPW